MIQVKNLSKKYRRHKQLFDAIRNISFSIERGEIFGLVGESGSGKTTLAKMLLKLIEPTSGEILLYGKPLSLFPQKILCRHIQMIFQDPYSSLNPRMSVGEILAEPLKIHDYPKVSLRVDELLELVGLPKSVRGRYPHEFSGGQRQRVGIARALALNPEFVICDEPISALDVSIQAQIINLLLKLQSDLGLTYLFISHDLEIVRYLSDRIGVIHQGEIVEIEKTEELCKRPRHPYTKRLFATK